MGADAAQNLRLVREFIEAFDAFDFERLRDEMQADPANLAARLAEFGEVHQRLIDPEVELDIAAMEGWTVFLPPDGRGRGLDTWREFWRNWFEAWSTQRVEYSGWKSGADWVLVDAHNLMRGRTSGVEVEIAVTQLWRLRRGRIVGFAAYPTRQRALAVVEGPGGGG
jgi:SnoaL-like domain